MNLILAGATGLVGGIFLTEAESSGHEVVTVGRRSLDREPLEVVTDFTTSLDLGPADAAICALGTTIGAAGSRAAFYEVDHDAVLRFATAAYKGGTRHFLLVSAVGADASSRVFYSRVKGETERDLVELGFKRVDIAQPALLLGARTENRPVEKLLQAADPLTRLGMLGLLDRYAGIGAITVARALLKLCEDSEPGIFRHENRALLAMANR
jgi:uncharacterized protein YbjT (DUF2867 family)